MCDSGIAVRRRLAFGCLLFAIVAAWPLRAQGPPAKDKEVPKKNTALKLPSGAIIVVTSNPEALDQFEGVYLSPEKFKELNEQIEQFKKQIAAEKAVPPSSCELEGRVEQRGSQSIVCMKATFKFRTNLPRSVVFLGCKKARAVEAKLEDGKLPLLASSDKGLTVQVDAAGEHSVALVVELPLLPRGPKGGEIGFELELPGAPISTLNFEAPSQVTRLSIGRRELGSPTTIPVSGTEIPLEVKRVDAKRLIPGQPGEALGPVGHLEVWWEDRGNPGATESIRSAECDVQVTIGEADIQAETRLRLKGIAKDWKFVAPASAEVAVGRASTPGTGKPVDFPIDQAPEVIRPEPGKSEWRIGFRETNSTELLVTIATRSPRNRSADPKVKTSWPVGPFAALGVQQQIGSIRIKSLPNLRVTAHLKGDTQRIDRSDDPAGEAIYRFRALPAGPSNQPGAPLVLDISAAAGAVQTRVQHHLSLGEGGWRLRSDILVTPIRTEVESLDVEVPVPGVFEASTPKLVEGIVPLRENGPRRRVIQVKLAMPQRAEFSLALEGFYPTPVGAQEASLVLPRLLNVIDRSGQVSVTVPEDSDLSGGAYQWESGKPGTRIHSLDYPATAEKTPVLTAEVSRAISHVELAWRPLRSDIRVEGRADVRLGEKQGRITQHFRYTFADRRQKKLRIRGPNSVTGVTVNPGSIEAIGPGDWVVNLPAEPAKETAINLAYSFSTVLAQTAEPARLSVPLLWPDGVSACESTVRVLRDRTAANRFLPSIDCDAWHESPTEIVPGESSLPLLVARANGINLPLVLAFQDAEVGAASIPAIWIDRVLIQAQTTEGGQRYRARFHLSKWEVGEFDLELPLGAVDIELRVNGIRTEARETSAERGHGQVLRVSLPPWHEPQQHLIEVDYRLAAGRGEGLEAWMTRWFPPNARGKVAIAAVRWQIAMPARSMPFSLGDAVFDERWAAPNGFAHPVAAYSTADLEKWLTQGLEPDGSVARIGWEMADAGVTAQQTSLAPVRIVAIPRTIWLFGVSLIVLCTGLLLSRLSRRSVGVAIALVCGGTIIAGLIWQQQSGQVLAATQPGMVILLAILGVQQILQWRYRRRLARMPGFSRLPSGSALAAANGRGSSRERPAINSPVEPARGE
jgi:hypothetical protein